MFISPVSVGPVTALCLTLLEVPLSAQGVLKGLEARLSRRVSSSSLWEAALECQALGQEQGMNAVTESWNCLGWRSSSPTHLLS